MHAQMDVGPAARTHHLILPHTRMGSDGVDDDAGDDDGDGSDPSTLHDVCMRAASTMWQFCLAPRDRSCRAITNDNPSDAAQHDVH